MPLPTNAGSTALPGPEPLPASLRGRDRTLVMGVVNVTPDSFSDGGEWFEPGAAIRHGRELLAEGADVLDVGGESTRPGSARVSVEDELARVLPVVHALAAEGAVVSVDTTRAVVAEQAVAAGALVVNDVSGGLADPAMAEVVARTGVVYVVMHWRGHADVMDSLEHYDDVVLDVRRELAERVDALVAAGVRREQLVVDPGLGFSKAGSANWPLLAGLDELASLGLPVLVGASRKRFLGHLLAGADGEPVAPLDRDHATAAVSALAAAAGAWCVRVHEVKSTADAVRVAQAWVGAGRSLDRSGTPGPDLPGGGTVLDDERGAVDQAPGAAAPHDHTTAPRRTTKDGESA